MDAEICRKSWREKISLRFKGCYGAAFFIRFHPFHCSTEVEICCICRCSGLLKFPQIFFRIHGILESARFFWRLYHNHGPQSFPSGVWLAQPIWSHWKKSVGCSDLDTNRKFPCVCNEFFKNKWEAFTSVQELSLFSLVFIDLNGTQHQ